jgi:hypothetical protein
MTLDPHRKAVFIAAQAYLERPIKIKNVVHSIQPIRIEGQDRNSSSTPKLVRCGRPGGRTAMRTGLKMTPVKSESAMV